MSENLAVRSLGPMSGHFRVRSLGPMSGHCKTEACFGWVAVAVRFSERSNCRMIVRIATVQVIHGPVCGRREREREREREKEMRHFTESSYGKVMLSFHFFSQSVVKAFSIFPLGIRLWKV